MQLITGAQVRMARSLLKWTREELAEKANVSRGTIRTLEDDIAIRKSIILDIHSVFDANGVEFLPDGSVRPRSDGVKDFRGLGGCDHFFANIEKMLTKNVTEVICMFDNQNMLTKPTGQKGRTNLERMESLNKVAVVKCLLLNDGITLPFQPSFEIRVFLDSQPSMLSAQFIYADEYTLALEQDRKFNFMHPVYMVLESPCLAGKAAKYFEPRWPISKPYIYSSKIKNVA